MIVVKSSFPVVEVCIENGKIIAKIDKHNRESLSQLISVSKIIYGASENYNSSCNKYRDCIIQFEGHVYTNNLKPFLKT